MKRQQSADTGLNKASYLALRRTGRFLLPLKIRQSSRKDSYTRVVWRVKRLSAVFVRRIKNLRYNCTSDSSPSALSSSVTSLSEGEDRQSGDQVRRPEVLPLRRKDAREAACRLAQYFSLGSALTIDGTDNYAFEYQYIDDGSESGSDSLDAEDIESSTPAFLPIRREDILTAKRDLKRLQRSRITDALHSSISAAFISDEKDPKPADAPENSLQMATSALETQIICDSDVRMPPATEGCVEVLETPAARHITEDLDKRLAQQRTMASDPYPATYSATSTIQEYDNPNPQQLALNSTGIGAFQDDYISKGDIIMQESSESFGTIESPIRDEGEQSKAHERPAMFFKSPAEIGATSGPSNKVLGIVHLGGQIPDDTIPRQGRESGEAEYKPLYADKANGRIQELPATLNIDAVDADDRGHLSNQVRTLRLDDEYVQTKAFMVPEDSGFFSSSGSPTEDRHLQSRMSQTANAASSTPTIPKVDLIAPSSPTADSINGSGKKMSLSPLSSPGSNLGLKLGALPAWSIVGMPRRTFQDKLNESKLRRGYRGGRKTITSFPLSQQVAADDDP